MFTRIRKIDQPFPFLNGFLLFLMTFIPFPTSLLAEYITHGEARVAGLVFAGSYVVLAIVYNLVWRHAAQGGRLLGPHIAETRIHEISRQYLLGLPAYLVAFLLAFVSVPASVGVCLLLALYFAFTGTMTRFFARERQPGKSPSAGA